MKDRSRPSGERAPGARAGSGRMIPPRGLPLAGRVHRRRGALLIGVLIVLLTISLLGATLSILYSEMATANQVEVDRARALYLAEAGVARAIYDLYLAGQTGGVALPTVPPTALGGGTYQVEIDPIAGVVVSTGTVNRIRRTIQVKYYLF